MKPTIAHSQRAIPVKAFYRDDDTCSFCGSMSTEFAILYLTTPGTTFSGHTWHKGFPDRFMITPKNRDQRRHIVFFVHHLKDVSDEIFQQFAELSLEVFGVAWFRDMGGIRFNCPRPLSPIGFQRKGHIGADGRPVHSDGYNSDQIRSIVCDMEKIIKQRFGEKPAESDPNLVPTNETDPALGAEASAGTN